MHNFRLQSGKFHEICFSAAADESRKSTFFGNDSVDITVRNNGEGQWKKKLKSEHNISCRILSVRQH